MDINEIRRINAITAYNDAPKLCKQCGKRIEYRKRYNSFCNRSCSASYNNIGVGRYFSKTRGTKTKITCEYCGKLTTKNKFCSLKCKMAKRVEQIRNSIDAGTYTVQHSSKILKDYLVEVRGYRCSVCKRKSWRGYKIPLNVHHIDGDATNNTLENVELLCLNCHGLTENFGRKNGHIGTRAYRRNKPVSDNG